MVEPQQTKDKTYTYLVKGANDDVNEKTKEMTGVYADNPELAKERLDDNYR